MTPRRRAAKVTESSDALRWTGPFPGLFVSMDGGSENRDLAVLTEMPVEGDRFAYPQPSHQDEALRVAQGIRLVSMCSYERYGPHLVLRANALGPNPSLCQRVQKLDRFRPPVAGAGQKERVGSVTTAFVVTRRHPSECACSNRERARSWLSSSATASAKNPPVSTKTRFTWRQRRRRRRACTCSTKRRARRTERYPPAPARTSNRARALAGERTWGPPRAISADPKPACGDHAVGDALPDRESSTPGRRP